LLVVLVLVLVLELATGGGAKAFTAGGANTLAARGGAKADRLEAETGEKGGLMLPTIWRLFVGEKERSEEGLLQPGDGRGDKRGPLVGVAAEETITGAESQRCALSC
jgi:hypothetical protein